MKILKIIHGYPMRYNAGSEVYSQMLCQGLAQEHEVHVFTRQENPFLADYTVSQETDPDDPRIQLHLVNLLSERQRYRYRHAVIDKLVAELVDSVNPDIVHIGHLNHLSTSLIYPIHQRHIPIVFTLHDYWLMCPRGQFMQRNGQGDLWAACDGQEDRKCAVQCYAGCASGAADEWEHDIQYWQDWINRRMQHIRDIAQLVDYFIAPAHYLYQRFVHDFDLPEAKMLYLDYGFDLTRLAKLGQREAGEAFTFGYIGTHIPAKGIQHLIQAFSYLKGECKLRIWGRPNQNTAALKLMAKELGQENNIEWRGEYRNDAIVSEVFNWVDCIVVPSIWVENSPLVIHEALQVRLPVITADRGGMAEYIKHKVNGLVFKHRDVASLAALMQAMLDDPSLAIKLGAKGYLQSKDGNIPDMLTHIQAIENIYQQAVQRKRRTAYGS